MFIFYLSFGLKTNFLRFVSGTNLCQENKTESLFLTGFSNPHCQNSNSLHLKGKMHNLNIARSYLPDNRINIVFKGF